jgi:hypothetical protein
MLAIRCVGGGYPLDADSPGRLLIGLLDRVECEALKEFQALFALMAGDELNLCIRQAARGQIGDHLITEQMRVDCLGNARPSAIVLYNLLHPARGERPEALGFEQIAAVRVGVQVTFQHQAEAGRKQDVAVLGALGLVDEHLALDIAAGLDLAEEALELCLAQQLRQLAFLLGLSEPQFFAHPLADVEKVGVAEPSPTRNARDLTHNRRFRHSVRRYEISPGCWAFFHLGPSLGAALLRLSAIVRNAIPRKTREMDCRAAKRLYFLSNAKLNATRSALFATEAKSIMIARGSVATDD